MPPRSHPLKPWGVYEAHETSVLGMRFAWRLRSHHDTEARARLGLGDGQMVAPTKTAKRGWWERAV